MDRKRMKQNSQVHSSSLINPYFYSGNHCTISAFDVRAITVPYLPLMFGQSLFRICPTIFGQSLFRICLTIWAIAVPYLPYYLGNHCSVSAFLFGQSLCSLGSHCYVSAVCLVNHYYVLFCCPIPVLFFFFSDNHCFYPRTQCFLLFICRFLLITVSLLISARAITVLCSGFGSQCFSILAMTAYANAFFFCPLVFFYHTHGQISQSRSVNTFMFGKIRGMHNYYTKRICFVHGINFGLNLILG